MAIGAIEQGFVQAGQEKLGIADPGDAGAAAIATIVADAIKAGQGIIPLKLYADLIAKTSANAADETGSGSPIIDAMRQLPGMPGGQTGEPSAQSSTDHTTYTDTSMGYARNPGDLKSDVPTFQPQMGLFPDWPSARGGALNPPPPTPPCRPSPGENPVQPENFEKSEPPL